jgi:mono/diheme cytochrome c family protein
MYIRIVRYSFTIITAFCVMALAGERAVAQVLKGKTAYGSLAEVVPIPTGARPQVPDGFSVQPVTSALRKPQVIRVAPNGDLFVADTMFDTVHVLRIPPGSAKPSREEVFASGLKQPFGIAFYPLGPNPRWVYIANSDGVVRFPYKNGDLKATGRPEQIIAGIPTTRHYARDIAFSADGHRLFFSIGSGSNAAQEMFPEPHLDADGTHMQIVATGLRNCEGMTVEPATGELWGRPVGVAVAKDGSMLVTEDGNGTIWRVANREPVQGTFDAAKGRDLYIAHCSVCHQANGEGLPNVFPPLQGSGVVNKDDATKHIVVVLDGMQGARAGGVVYASAMPPFAGKLSDAEIADIIDYERSSWGNHGKPVTAAQVAAERASPK